MAEFGIASGAIGVVSLGLEIVKELLNYYGAWKDRDKDVSSMCNSADHLSRTLEILSSKIEPPAAFDPIVKTNVEENIKTVNDAIQKLKHELERIQATTALSTKSGIRSTMRRHMYRALYPFKEETLRKIGSMLSDVRSNLNLVLQVLHIDETQDINQKVDSIVRWQQDEEVRKIIEWLSPVNFWLRQADILRQRQPGTGEWLLKDRDFLNWEIGSEHFLWCQGSPGAGKTVLTSIVIEFLERDLRSPDIGLAFFYCNHKDNLMQTLEFFFSAVARQLLEQKLTIPEDVSHLYRKHCGKGTLLTLTECLELLRSLANDYSEVYIVIDALDECIGQEKEPFWSDLVNQLKACIPNLHLFCTSRHIEDVGAVMQSATQIEICASEADIKAYVRDKLKSKDNLVELCHQDPYLQEHIVSTVTSKANGLFLTAQLYVESLSVKETLRAVRRTLKTLPDSLDTIYDDAMNRIKHQPSQQLALRVIAWVVYALRPLRAIEIQHAVAIEELEPEDDYIPDECLTPLSRILNACAGLVRSDEETGIMGLVHYTTQEYFNRHGSRHFPYAQRDIGIACIKYLSLGVFGEGPSPNNKLFRRRLQENPLLQYVASQFCNHIRLQTHDHDLHHLALQLFKDRPRMSSASQVLQDFPNDFEGIHYAAYFGLADIVESLLETIDPNIMDSKDRTALFYAADNGREEVVKVLLFTEDIDPNLEDRWGNTPLYQASLKGHYGVVEFLLSTDSVDPNEENIDGETPLCVAAEEGHDDVVELLLARHDIIPDKRDRVGATPLFRALQIYNSSLDVSDKVLRIAKLFLDRDDVDPHAKWGMDSTYMTVAAENNHENVINLLLSRGLDPDAKDNIGRTPLSWAAHYHCDKTFKLLLARNDVNPDSKDETGRTPLSCAAETGNCEAVKLLLARGLDSDTKDNDGRTPLSWAAEGSEDFIHTNEDMVELLIINGADPDAKDNMGRTPLFWAAKWGRLEEAQKLLSRCNIDPDSKDNNGQTPIMIAEKEGYDTVVELIAQKIKARQEEQAESMSEENDNEYANGTIRPYPFDTSDEDRDASSTRETKRIVIRGIREDQVS